MTKQSYLIINWVFAGIILAIFIYSGIYSPESNSHPIKCIHEELLGSKCPTCGMSRGFSAIVREGSTTLMNFNKIAFQFFIFFCCSAYDAAISHFAAYKIKDVLKSLTNIDITISLLLFLFTFRNLIFQTIYIFYKMLLTGNVA